MELELVAEIDILQASLRRGLNRVGPGSVPAILELISKIAAKWWPSYLCVPQRDENSGARLHTLLQTRFASSVTTGELARMSNAVARMAAPAAAALTAGFQAS